MSEECTHDCSSCHENCDHRPPEKASTNADTHIKHVIGIVSGKGGVGKSTVTGLLAMLCNKIGKKVGILDADITGPSIPRLFGVHGILKASENEIYPCVSKSGIEMVSSNLMLDNETDPVLWRGPILASLVKQFWTDVKWGDLDYLYVDMPPGTGDVGLTVYQSVKLDGIIIVTSPQDLVSMIVSKAVKMAQMMDIPILGVIENYSYVLCPDCGKAIDLFGSSATSKVCEDYNLKLLARMPIDPALVKLCDEGRIDEAAAPFMHDALDAVLGL
jgi:Mrp family chromosome partitioning ATPase